VRPAIIGALAACLAAQTVEFNRDIRPILSDRCYTCHGPDAGKRLSKLRLDADPGDAAKREILRRVTETDAARRMPFGGPPLPDREIELLRRWVEQGAPWQPHWAFIAPTRPAVPAVKRREWPRNPIDHFVLARLEREGVAPSPEASGETLLRRASLDLTGLPPSPAELDAFLADDSPDAWARAVDRLLASPRYGERMAYRWLEAARYADTNGYQTDAARDMWRWRDWVIEAFNRNLPFDRFTVEQMAGDLLPNATLDQRIATGFHRNHRGNGEGGIIPEEYLVEYAADRVETTSTVWLGLTMGCARCHDHKYDPITQREFYQLYAYFNNIPERGRYFKYGNTPPIVRAPTGDDQARVNAMEARLAAAERKWSAVAGEATLAQESWEQTQVILGAVDWPLQRGLGWVFRPAELPMDAGNVAAFGFYDKFTLSAWIYPESPSGAILSRTQPLAEADGYCLCLKDGRVQLNLVQRWLDDALRVETAEPLAQNRWHHVTATYDGSLVADGVRLYINGRPAAKRVLLDELNQNFRVNQPFRIGAGGLPENRFRGRIEDVRIYQVALSDEEAAVVAERGNLTEIAAIPPEKRTPGQAAKIRLAFLDRFAPAEIRDAWREVAALRLEHRALVESLPTVMVMEEMTPPRETFLLVRGAYDRPGDKVARGVPAILPRLPAGPNDRLALARWLVDPANPLTARVAVNRLWQMLFGAGLVRTVEDFGAQGEWPSHPDLLDWLATEFVATGWDVKALLKTIVTSATYRQSSRVTPALLERDPENRLLARGPRLRLSAEMVRDQALFVSGLLVEKTGGPSVKPYQPAGLWRELSGGEDYRQDRGENLWRRGLYTFWKRAAPPPMMMNFDAAGRETCVVRESRTNTPLQALNLMNDVTYVEAARALAQRMMREGGARPEDRVAFGFRLATSRRPREAERDVLVASFRHYLDRYQTRPGDAAKLVSQGESPRDERLDVRELAAYAAIASLILNLDETITKE
jgi:hypothetical protein